MEKIRWAMRYEENEYGIAYGEKEIYIYLSHTWETSPKWDVI
jgi:hypothetical protein